MQQLRGRRVHRLQEYGVNRVGEGRAKRQVQRRGPLLQTRKLQRLVHERDPLPPSVHGPVRSLGTVRRTTAAPAVRRRSALHRARIAGQNHLADTVPNPDVRYGPVR